MLIFFIHYIYVYACRKFTFVPRTFLKLVATSKLVECWKAPTLHTAARGLDTCQKDKRPCSDIISGEGLLFTCTDVICHTSYLIKADSIHADSDRVSGEHLLRGDLI